MMKKTVFVLLCLGLLTFLVGCGAKSSQNADNAADVLDVSIEGEEPEANASGVDVDLTILSETVAYSEVFNMVTNPDIYDGLTVKMEGTYSHVRDELLDKDYFSCTVMDAGACCTQFLDFEPSADYIWPDDFPLEGDTIRVQGTFDVYTEGDYTFCLLRDATFLD